MTFLRWWIRIWCPDKWKLSLCLKLFSHWFSVFWREKLCINRFFPNEKWLFVWSKFKKVWIVVQFNDCSTSFCFKKIHSWSSINDVNPVWKVLNECWYKNRPRLNNDYWFTRSFDHLFLCNNHFHGVCFLWHRNKRKQFWKKNSDEKFEFSFNCEHKK